MADGWRSPRAFADEPDPDPALGVFETVLVTRGVARFWGRHRARLAASCAALYGAALDDDLDARVARAAAGTSGRARLRVRVRPRPHGGGLASDVEAAALDLPAPAEPPALAPVRVAHGFGAHKLSDRRWLERIEVEAGPDARALLVAGADAVLETTRANVFALTGGSLSTPPLDGSILPGVTRDVLIEAARRLGIAVREEPVALDALRAADAVLLTGSLRLLEAHPAEGGRAGALVAELRAALGRAAEAEVD